MKCTNCGKNNAVNHYRYEVNGQVQEAHLCADCARKLQPEREFAARTRDMFGDMFSDSLFGGELFGGRTGGLLSGFFDPFEGVSGRFFEPFGGMMGGIFGMPGYAFGAPRIEISFPEAERSALDGESAAEKAGVDPELSRKREINALREQMRQASESEDYEKAAKLRDRLRELENGGKNG